MAGHEAAVGSTPPSPASGGATSISEAIPKKKDPVAPTPTTKWYIRIGTGEQYGPVHDEQMRQWFDENRIVANTPIWRDGWADWQAASTVFRALGDLVPTPPLVAARPMSSSDVYEAVNAYNLNFDRPAATPKSKPRESWTQAQWTLIISVSMLLLIVVLGTIMLLMLLNTGEQPEPSPPQPPAAKTPLSDAGYANQFASMSWPQIFPAMFAKQRLTRIADVATLPPPLSIH